MKRYIRASISYERSSQGLRDKLSGLKKDFKNLSRCDSLEDVKSTEWNYWRVDNFIQMAVDGGKSEEEAIDDMLDSIYQDIQSTKADIDNRSAYEQEADRLMTHLEHLDGAYELISNDGNIMIFNAPEGANHRDCIEFVDDVVSAIQGKYSGTGRGGSWTVWDLRSSSGIYFKAGWYNSTGSGKWYIEVQ